MFGDLLRSILVAMVVPDFREQMHPRPDSPDL